MERYRISTLLLAIISSLLFIKILLGNGEKDKISYIIEKDTIIVHQKEVIKVDKIIPKIVYLRDTIIESKPFIATIDTVIQKDTVFLRYDFPENLFSMKLSPSADSIRIEKIYEYKERGISWFERATMFAAGFGIAFLITK